VLLRDTILKLHPWVKDFLKHDGVIFGGIVLKTVEAFQTGTSLEDYLKTGDIDVLIETNDIIGTHSYLMGISTDTSVIVDDKYGLSTYAHYHITCTETGYLFDVSVTTPNSSINLINPRFSVENMGLMMRDNKPTIDMLYKSHNCQSLDVAIGHVLEKKLIIVEPLSCIYKADPDRFIERVCRKVTDGWILSDDDRTKSVISGRYQKLFRMKDQYKKMLENYIGDTRHRTSYMDKYNNDKQLLLEIQDDCIHVYYFLLIFAIIFNFLLIFI
jgi:hypothetical protein